MTYLHVLELKTRLLYYLLSYLSFFLLSLFFCPKILSYSPIFFLQTHWEDAIFTYFSLSTLAATLFSLPQLLYHLLLFFKPALLPRELSLLHLALCYFLFSFSLFWSCAPILFSLIPDLLLSFHGDWILFSPTLDVLQSLAWDFSFCSFLLLLIPLLILLHIRRPILLLFALLLSSIFSDILSLLFIFSALTLLIEFSLFFLLWSRLFIIARYPGF